MKFYAFIALGIINFVFSYMLITYQARLAFRADRSAPKKSAHRTLRIFARPLNFVIDNCKFFVDIRQYEEEHANSTQSSRALLHIAVCSTIEFDWF